MLFDIANIIYEMFWNNYKNSDYEENYNHAYCVDTESIIVNKTSQTL